jgi:hypothetical protein
LGSIPLISNVLIKRCCAASRCGAMIVADMNQLTLAGWERDERRKRYRRRGVERTDDRRQLPPGTVRLRRAATSVRKWLPLKIL